MLVSRLVCNAHACVVRCGGASEPRAVFALGSVRCVRLCTEEGHAGKYSDEEILESLQKKYKAPLRRVIDLTDF